MSDTRKQRNRATLVCQVCKRRKVKCDRGTPCNNCIKSHREDECIYDYVSSRITKPIPRKKASVYTSKNVSPLSEANMAESYKDDETVLNYPFSIISDITVFRKPSRTQARCMSHANKFRKGGSHSFQVLMSFFRLIDSERKLWKDRNWTRNTSQPVITNLWTNSNEMFSSYNEMIDKLICQNYYAILERLNYFNLHLNEFLFNSYIPMGAVHLIFHTYFIVKQDGITFKKPKKAFEYSLIAFITSLVALTNIFSKCDHMAFNFPLNSEKNDFNRVTLLLLNASNYRRKTSIFVVYTLLNLRLSLLVFGDEQSDGMARQNSYPLFESALNISKEQGIHFDIDRIFYVDRDDVPYLKKEGSSENVSFFKAVPLDSLKALWNYLLVTDANYSYTMEIPPCIDDRYSHGFYEMNTPFDKCFSSYINTARSHANLLFSQKKVTLTEALDQINILSKSLSLYESFENLDVYLKDERKWGILNMKIQILDSLSRLTTHLCLILNEKNISSIFPSGILEDQRNMRIISQLRNELKEKYRLSSLLGLTTLFRIIQSNPSEKFILYIRQVFSYWVGIKNLGYLDAVIEEDICKRENLGLSTTVPTSESFKLPEMPVYDISAMENALINYDPVKHAPILNYIEQKFNPLDLASMLTNIYQKSIMVPSLVADYNSFIVAKIFLLGIYFLYSYIKSSSCVTFDITKNSENLKEMTRNIIKKHLKEGKLDHLVPAERIMKEMDENTAPGNRCHGTQAPTPSGSKPLHICLNDNNGFATQEPEADSLFFDLFEDVNLKNIFDEIEYYFDK